MSPHSHIFLVIIIVFVYSISSCCGLDEDVQPNLINNLHLYDDHLDQETGYDSHAYPSQFLSSYDLSPDFHKVESGISSYLEKLAAKTLTKTVSVKSHGAKGDGKSDDTKAFEKAWDEACSSSSGAVFLVPENKQYLLRPIRFEGPCKAAMTVQINGTLLASDDRGDYKKDRRHWLIFDSVEDLLVEGGGVIDGNGEIWWRNSCKVNKHKSCKEAPTALTFYKVSNLTVKDLNIQNAQQIQVSFEKCEAVEASNLTVTAPGDSPNTDGVHITSTENMQLSDSVIQTGDDCISIESGSQNLKITNITCGPGHGISIGSLGDGNSGAHVSDVIVNGAKISGTSNGVRIKTYQGGSGNASNIKFENIEMENVRNPIIIDQNYCDRSKPCEKQKSAVLVKNVLYRNITGTSATDVAIKFDCSQSHPCQGIVLRDVTLRLQKDEVAQALCNNVELEQIGTISPSCPDDCEDL